MEKTRKLSTSLTDSRFGGMGWSMIIYSMLMYLLFALLTTDGQNLFPTVFAGVKGWDPTQLLAYATPASIVGIVGGFIAARLLITKSTKMISCISLIITGVAFAVWAYSSSTAMYLILMMVICFFGSAISFVAPTLMADWFPRKKGIALGWATIGAPLSTAVGVAGFSAMLTGFGFQTAFLVMGIIVIIIGIVTLFWVKDTPEQAGRLPDNMDPAVAEKLSHQQGQEVLMDAGENITVGKVLKTPNTWLISIGYGFLWLVTTGVVSQFIPRMLSVGYTEGEAMTFLTVSAIIAIPGSYFWGFLDGKIGTKLASAVYAISYIVALLLLIFASSPVLIWIGCIFIGLGLGGILNLIPSMTITAFGPSGFKQANSIITTIASLIRCLAFALTAILINPAAGDAMFTLPYLVFIAIDIVGGILLLTIKKKKA